MSNSNSTKDADAQRPNEPVVMPLDATGLNIYRFSPDRAYTPIKFLRGYKGCEIFYRRLRAFGFVIEDKNIAEGVADITNKEGDSIESFYLTGDGLKHCYNKLNLRVSA